MRLYSYGNNIGLDADENLARALEREELEREELVSVLEHAHAFSSDYEYFDRYGRPEDMYVPMGCHVLVDFNLMAEAIYKAGYRKVSPDDATFRSDVALWASHIYAEVAQFKKVTERQVEIAQNMDSAVGHILENVEHIYKRIGGSKNDG